MYNNKATIYIYISVKYQIRTYEEWECRVHKRLLYILEGTYKLDCDSEPDNPRFVRRIPGTGRHTSVRRKPGSWGSRSGSCTLPDSWADCPDSWADRSRWVCRSAHGTASSVRTGSGNMSVAEPLLQKQNNGKIRYIGNRYVASSSL